MAYLTKNKAKETADFVRSKGYTGKEAWQLLYFILERNYDQASLYTGDFGTTFLFYSRGAWIDLHDVIPTDFFYYKYGKRPGSGRSSAK